MSKAMLIPPLALLPSAVLNVISLSLGGAGAFLMVFAATSLSEHADMLLYLLEGTCGLLLVVFGFWFRDWKNKVDKTRALVAQHSIKLAHLDERTKNGNRMIEELSRQVEFHMRDQRAWEEWAVERLYALAPHLGEKLELPPLRLRPTDSQEIKKG